MGQVGSTDSHDDHKTDKLAVTEPRTSDDQLRKSPSTGFGVVKSSHVKDQIDSLIEAYLTDPSSDGLSEVSSTDDNKPKTVGSFSTLRASLMSNRRFQPESTADGPSEMSSNENAGQKGEGSKPSSVPKVSAPPPARTHIKLKLLIDRVLETSISTDVLKVDDKRFNASESLFKNIAHSPEKLKQSPLQAIKQNVIPSVSAPSYGETLIDKNEKENVVSEPSNGPTLQHGDRKMYDVSEIIERVIKETADIQEENTHPKILSMYDHSAEPTIRVVDSPKVNNVNTSSATKVQPIKNIVRYMTDDHVHNKQRFVAENNEVYRYEIERRQNVSEHYSERPSTSEYDPRERYHTRPVTERDTYPNRSRSHTYYKYPESIPSTYLLRPNLAPDMYTVDYNPERIPPNATETRVPHIIKKPVPQVHLTNPPSDYAHLKPPHIPQRISPGSSPPPLLKVSPETQRSAIPALLPTYPWIPTQPPHGYPQSYPRTYPQAQLPTRLPHPLYQPGIRSGIPFPASMPLGYHTTPASWPLQNPELYPPSSILPQFSTTPNKHAPPQPHVYPGKDEYRIVTVDHVGQKSPQMPNHIDRSHQQQQRLYIQNQQLSQQEIPQVYRRNSLPEAYRHAAPHVDLPLSATYEQNVRREMKEYHRRHPDFSPNYPMEHGMKEHRVVSHGKTVPGGPAMLTPEARPMPYKSPKSRNPHPPKPHEIRDRTSPASLIHRQPNENHTPNSRQPTPNNSRHQQEASSPKQTSPLDLSAREQSPLMPPNRRSPYEIDPDIKPFISPQNHSPNDRHISRTQLSNAFTDLGVIKEEGHHVGYGSGQTGHWRSSHHDGTPSPRSHTSSPSYSDDSHKNISSKSGRKYESYNNLIGDHPPNDILYLICQLCRQTYGSQYGFRRHFRNQHRCEPSPQHVLIQTISETKSARDYPVSGTQSMELTRSEGHPVNTPQTVVKPELPCLEAEAEESHDSPDVQSDDPPVLQLENHDSGDDCKSDVVSKDGSETGIMTGNKQCLACPFCHEKFQLNDFGVYRRHCRSHEKTRNVQNIGQTGVNESSSSSSDHQQCQYCFEIITTDMNVHLTVCASKIQSDKRLLDDSNDNVSNSNSNSNAVSPATIPNPVEIRRNSSTASIRSSTSSPGVPDDATGVQYRHKKFGRLLKPSDAHDMEPPEKRVKLSPPVTPSLIVRRTSSEPASGSSDRITEKQNSDDLLTNDVSKVDSMRKVIGDKREARHILPFVWDRVTRSKSSVSKN